MKRHFQSVIPLIIFLSLIALLFTACTLTPDSVPAGPVSPSPSPSIPSESSIPPESSGVSGPNSSSESDEPSVSEPYTGLWQYEYGDRDFAQIRIYNETEEGFDFDLFIVEYDQKYNQEGMIIQGGFSTTARKAPDGKALYSAGQKESSNTIIHVDGYLAINNKYLNITYENLKIFTDNYRTQLPTTFERVPADQTQQAQSKLPFFTQEIVGLPLGLTIEESDRHFGPLLEVQTAPEYPNSTTVKMTRKYTNTNVFFYFPEGDEENCYFERIETVNPSLGFVRNIQVGDSLESVITKFPNEQKEIQLEDKKEIQFHTLYGKMPFETFGCILYEENRSKEIWFSDGWKSFRLELDATNHVSKIIISNTY